MREEGWITKAEAAALLGYDERTIERRARAGKIERRTRPGFPTLYRAADVEKLQQAGSGEVRTGFLEAGPAANGNGRAHTDPIGALALSADDPIRQLCALVVQALTQGPIGPTGPTAGPTGPTAAYVTKADALAIVGLSDRELRRAVHAGEVKRRGRRYRRTDLEAL